MLRYANKNIHTGSIKTYYSPLGLNLVLVKVSKIFVSCRKNTCQVHWKQCKTYVLQTPGHNLEIVSLYLHNIFYRPDSEFCGHNSSNYVWYRLCNCLEIHKFKSDCLYNYYFLIDIRGLSNFWTVNSTSDRSVKYAKSYFFNTIKVWNSFPNRIIAIWNH